MPGRGFRSLAAKLPLVLKRHLDLGTRGDDREERPTVQRQYRCRKPCPDRCCARNVLKEAYLSEVIAGGSCHSLGKEVGFDLKPRTAAFVQGAVALRLDDLVAAGEVPAPDYVKIDVDGFEHRVVRGMEKTLRDGKVRSLLIELNPALSEHLEMRSLLEELGFAWDAAQVARSTRVEGPFKGVAEHVFKR